MKIFKRILISEIIIAFVLIGIFYSLIPQIVYETNLDQTIADSLNMNQQLISRLETAFKDLEKFGSSVENDRELADLIHKDLDNHTTQNVAYIKNYLSNLGRYNKMDPYQVLGIYFVLDNGRKYESIGLPDEAISHIQNNLLSDYIKSGSIPTYSEPFQLKKSKAAVNYFTDTIEKGYCYIMPYKKYGISGNIVIISQYDDIAAIFDNFVKESKDFLLLTKDNVPVFPGGKTSTIDYTEVFNQINKTHRYMDASVQNSQGFITVRFSRYGGWKLIVQQHKNDIMRQNSNLIIFYLVMLSIYIILFFSILVPWLNSIFRPLRKLAKQMREVSKGNLDVKVKVKTKDEIGELGNTFNYMSTELKKHIEVLVEKTKEENAAKYGFLVSQIDPHFIYNTMNTITYLASKNKNEDVIKVNEAMIAILKDRLRINVNEVFDSVSREIEVIKKYLTIQSYRYRKTFKVKWDVAENVLEEQIPKTIIQPLVENALYHGLLTNKDDEGDIIGGLITIRIYEKEGMICIEVLDNGRGMTEEEYNSIFEAEKTARGEHIGINSIRERLGYIYNSDFSFKIKTESGVGTGIYIALPKTDQTTI